jgi:hypothetical protein
VGKYNMDKLERIWIQNLSNITKKLPLRSLTMQGAVSIEITEIIWICNVMGFFFKNFLRLGEKKFVIK